MEVKETNLEGCFIIEPKIYYDNRGCFFESFNLKKFKKLTGLTIEFVQDNVSVSKFGVIRGLHMQEGKFAQAKLIRVSKGKILDVVVDVRENSKTYGEVYSTILSSENQKQLFVPRGFLHGFSTLEEDSVVNYKADNYYNKQSEKGVLFNDKDLNIDWLLKEENFVISEKDSLLNSFYLFRNL